MNGAEVDVGPARQRGVLAALVVDLNRVVPVEQLADRVWGDRTPPRARAALHSYVSRLRKALSPAPEVKIVRRSAGYSLMADESVADIHRFRDLCDRALGSGGGDGLQLLGTALRLWRGAALADLNTGWADSERRRLDHERHAAETAYTELRLRGGHHAELVAELSVRWEEHPTDERVAGQLMTALYRCGRQADALDVYERVRTQLREELGADTSPVLGRLHQQILDGKLDQPGERLPVHDRFPVPHQLAAQPRGFVGRAEELAHLTDMSADTGDSGEPMVISVITGPGGIGKTWLALRWAHERIDRFPDGQVQACLRGFDAVQQPLRPATALRGILTALGVAPEAIPDDVDTRSALYRSLLAGKRMLVFLDDARDVSQVRPLLPGSGSCTVLITSRHRLTDLVSSDGARVLSLDVFSEQEGRELLARRLGANRLTSEPRAVSELLGHCHGVPLTLGIVAARATAQAQLPLDVLVSELRDAATFRPESRTDVLTASLRSVVSSSCVTLTPCAATLFALLGLAPGPSVSTHAAASLAALPLAEARACLRELQEANLALQPVPDRYRMHDLINAVAAERASREIPETLRTAAERRVADFYLHTAAAGQRLLNPHRPGVTFGAPADGCLPRPALDPAGAVAWFEAESDCLLATQELAVRRRWHTTVWQLAWTLTPFQRWCGNHYDNVAVWRHGLAATEELGDLALRARAHRWLGHAYARAGESARGLSHLRRACALAERTADPVDRAYGQHTLSLVWGWQGEDDRAVECARRAERLFAVLGNPIWQAEALNTLGWYEGRLGRYDDARAHCARALALNEQHGYADGQAHALDSLGYIAYRGGRFTEALDYYHRALTVRRDLGDRYGEATTLASLGDVYAALGQRPEAYAAWHKALDLHLSRQCLAEAREIQRSLSLGDPVHAGP
ncbi:BTAD domain-containing putative transcriptional regulator [Amycolatopsis sp. NPDC059027]|uniref:AfsR/SARP family transcriptional regulator n=1 Tax=Amycolatopsis sp. NPDC059027 TaxID=3346709 RepID=UPI0036715D76